MSLTNLSKAKAFNIHELSKVIEINKNKDLVFAVFQVMAASLKSLNISQKFLIVGLITNLGGNYFL